MIINYLPSAPEHPIFSGTVWCFTGKYVNILGGPLNDGVMEEVGKFN